MNHRVILVMSLCSLFSINSLPMSIFLPNVTISHDQIHLCTAIPVTRKSYIAGFTPRPLEHVYHHIWVFGCHLPGSMNQRSPNGQPHVWDCGAGVYPEDNYQEGYQVAGICDDSGAFRHLFTFEGEDLFPLTLRMPPDVGIPVGPGTGIDHIVLGVHFIRLSDLRGGWTGSPGMTMDMREGNVKNKAAKFAFLVWGTIRGNGTGSVRGFFSIPDSYVVHVFAVGVHTHMMGVDAEVRVRRFGDNRTTVIYKRDPQQFKTAHLLAQSVTLVPGDVVSVTCTYNNTSPNNVRVEQTEMCTTEMLYYTDKGTPLPHETCAYDEDGNRGLGPLCPAYA